MIQIEHLYKNFGPTQVLKDINLRIEQGDVVAILGPSGTGKSTLLRCLNYLVTPTSGIITVGDVRVDAQKYRKQDVLALRKHLAMVFQNYNLFRNMTALENVAEALITVHRRPKSEAMETALKLLQKVGMEERKDFYPSKLSGGQQQRVAIARAIATRPPIIMADEPTGALDSRTGRHVLEILRGLYREGTTILLITHDDGIAATARRVVRLSDGKIIADHAQEVDWE